LGDIGYAGADTFVMRRIGVHEVAEGSSNANAIRAYNMMHAGRRIKLNGELEVSSASFDDSKNLSTT
jgi:hypothetical protein